MAATYRLTYDADGNPTRIKDDFAAAGAPTVDDDAASGGWTTGSLWYVPATDTLYLCESAATGAADWVAVTGGGPGGGAPTDATYLVGTASAGLSNEIVVGTTPGGELGGTWAAPTVDATHAGSSHADVQAAAEATAAGALAAHAGDADAHHAWPLTEPDIPAAIARDTEVTAAVATHAGDAAAHHARYTDAEADARAAAAVATHEAAPDPHPAYLTAAEGDAAYEPAGEVASHAADPDAHHAWPLADGDIPAAIARDAEVGAAITAHAGDADAHHASYTDAEAVAAVGPHYAPGLRRGRRHRRRAVRRRRGRRRARRGGASRPSPRHARRPGARPCRGPDGAPRLAAGRARHPRRDRARYGGVGGPQRPRRHRRRPSRAVQRHRGGRRHGCEGRREPAPP